MRVAWAASVAAVAGVVLLACQAGEPSRDPAETAAGSEASFTGAAAADVRLAPRADAPLVVRDRASGLEARIRLEDAAPVEAAFVSRTARRYPGAAPGGGDVRVVLRADGAEDFVRFERAPALGYLDWVVELGRGVAGLRLVDDTLELLDAAGAPRLRMNAPTARDATGRTARLVVSVEGCAVDRSPRAPFARAGALVPPGATHCVVRVRHDLARLAFPAEIDPAWTTTSALPGPRYNHFAERLPSGRVLVAGGFVPDPVTTEQATTSALVWDPATGTFATTGPLATARADVGAARLATGDVLVTGGLGGYGEITVGTAELYREATGAFSPSGTLLAARAGHSAVPLGDGTVLVAAGYDNGELSFTLAELWTNGTFTAAGNISRTRFFHGAVALADGRALLGGGTDPFQGSLGSLELYTPGVGFAPAASLPLMRSQRTLTSAALLPDGSVLFAGGYNAQEGALRSAERWDPVTNTWSVLPARFGRARYGAHARRLVGGQIAFMGGQTLAREHADVELFDPVTAAFVRVAPEASDERAYGHTITDLADGRALVVAGYDVGPQRMLTSALVLDLALPTPDGGPDDPADGGPGPDPVDAAPDARPRDPHEGDELLDAAWLDDTKRPDPAQAEAGRASGSPAAGSGSPDPAVALEGGGCATSPAGGGASAVPWALVALALSAGRASRAGGRGRSGRDRPSSPRPSGCRAPRS